jgi:hypothetical protein
LQRCGELRPAIQRIPPFAGLDLCERLDQLIAYASANRASAARQRRLSFTGGLTGRRRADQQLDGGGRLPAGTAVLLRTPGGTILDTLIHKYFTRSAMRWGTLLADLGVPCE